MAVQKNHDLYVIFKDAIYWAKKPPQFYWLTGGAIVIGLLVIYNKPSPQVTSRPTYQQPQYQPPAYVPPHIEIPPQAQPRPRAVPSETSANPLKDNCPVDFIFVDSLQNCTPIISTRWIGMAKGNKFSKSGRFTMRVRAGSVRLTYSGQSVIILPSAPPTPPTHVENGGTVTALEENTSVGTQF